MQHILPESKLEIIKAADPTLGRKRHPSEDKSKTPPRPLAA
jgi:hypothetical protein